MDGERFPRLWIGRDGTMIDMDDAERCHSTFVIENPETFGIDPAAMASQLATWEADEEDVDFEFVITLAEACGWVRTARDEASSGSLTGASLPVIRRALARLQEQGLTDRALYVAVETLEPKVIRGASWQLDADQVSKLIRFGSTGRTERYDYTIPHSGPADASALKIGALPGDVAPEMASPAF